ncbi:hypothetical protein [Campylobacter sp.]|uniref:hypothetical protein n=1 Tax=Campylobacter sp. TaxID=205 RepID=UPI002A64DE63|nr:hypothetical protein [Campylobacter sp.]MDD7704203.1 hypothetical protein [Campylobacteraceae bacterium]MDY2635090.1 hypothetical protein [Campylobacter sp.]
MINTSITQPVVDKEIRELERDKRIKDVSQRVTSTKDTTTKDATSKPLFDKQEILGEKQTLIEQKLGELTNKLLSGLKSGEQGPNMPRLLQVAPNLASDVRELLKALDGNEKLATFKEALAKFIKPIENLSPQGVAQGIKDSGIMLEAKIAQSLEAQSLPSKIKELLSQMKNTQNQGLKESFLKLPNDSDAKKSINDLETLLKEQKKLNQEAINNSPFKALAKASNALENAAKYLDKLSNLGKNLSLKTAANLLSRIESSIQNAQKSANNYNLNSATLKDARAIREQINASANELQNALNLLKNKDSNFKAFLTRYDPNNKQNATLKEALSKQNEPKANHIRINIQTSNTGSTAHSSSLNANAAQNASQNSSFSQNASFSQNSTLTQEQNSFKNINLSQFKEATSSEVNTPNLQGKITELARALTSLKNTLSPELASAKSALEEIKSLARLSKSAAKSIGAIKPNNAEQALKELQSDMKSVLLNLKESTQNQSSTQNIHTAAQRLLTQIEIHQLASFAQNSLQTYLPYHWDELNSSNLSFKRGNKDKFYARIELSFVKFGEIGIVLGLAENKFLDVSIQTGNDGFKELILSETKSLKRALNELGLVVNNFFVASKGGKSAYEQFEDIDLGYNIKA